MLEFLEIVFPVSGVRTSIVIPPLIAMVVSFFTSMGCVLLYIDLRLLYEFTGSAKVRSAASKTLEEKFKERFSCSTIGMFMLAFVVGIIGGAIIAPFCVAVFHLPVYTIAGAALMGTFITSVARVLLYSVIPAGPGPSTAPDWLLGFLFGIGGTIGIYFGARAQKFVPQKYIKLVLGMIIVFLSSAYIMQYFV